jgi:hypothetical protein
MVEETLAVLDRLEERKEGEAVEGREVVIWRAEEWREVPVAGRLWPLLPLELLVLLCREGERKDSEEVVD